MKIEKGKIAVKDGNVFIEVDGKNIPVNKISLSNKEYNVGEEVQGVIQEEKFNICRDYDHSRKGKLFGFISDDELNDDFITITVMADFRPKLMSTMGLNKSEYEVGEIIRVRRELINNY